MVIDTFAFMKYVLICTVLFSLCGCTERKSPNLPIYYLEGKAYWEAPLDAEGRLNGLVKLFDSSNHVMLQTEVCHDTLSGFVETFRPSGRVQGRVFYARGLYNGEYSDKFFAETVYNFTDVRQYYYNEQGQLGYFHAILGCHKDTCHGLMVKYSNDSIIKIHGNPNISLLDQDDWTLKCSVEQIPLCSTFFELLDSNNRAIKSGRDKESIAIDLRTNYVSSILVVYTDSTSHTPHHIKENVSKIEGSSSKWRVDTYTIWDDANPYLGRK